MSMYVILWRFRPVVGQESEFERAYGPSGEWARLFRRDEGYLGTELLLRRSDAEITQVNGWNNAGVLQHLLARIVPRIDKQFSAARGNQGLLSDGLVGADDYVVDVVDHIRFIFEVADE